MSDEILKKLEDIGSDLSKDLNESEFYRVILDKVINVFDEAKDMSPDEKRAGVKLFMTSFLQTLIEKQGGDVNQSPFSEKVEEMLETVNEIEF